MSVAKTCMNCAAPMPGGPLVSVDVGHIRDVPRLRNILFGGDYCTVQCVREDFAATLHKAIASQPGDM